MYRILVPLDASTQAVRAIPWADALGGALGARVLLVRTVDWQGPELPRHGETGDGLLQSMAQAEAELKGVAKTFQRVTPSVKVIHGKPEAIESLARDRDIDLIVMATHGRGGVERTLVGSVSGKVVARSGLPVLSIGPGVPERTVASLRKILVAYDGSSLSKTIFFPLIPLALGLRAQVILFRALEAVEALAIQGALIPIENPFASSTRAAASDVDGAAEELRREGLTTEVASGFGKPGPAILETAAREQADVIALTTHSRMGLARWMLGSVAEQVIAEARVPVLVFHPAETEAGRRSA